MAAHNYRLLEDEHPDEHDASKRDDTGDTDAEVIAFPSRPQPRFWRDKHALVMLAIIAMSIGVMALSMKLTSHFADRTTQAHGREHAAKEQMKPLTRKLSLAQHSLKNAKYDADHLDDWKSEKRKRLDHMKATMRSNPPALLRRETAEAQQQETAARARTAHLNSQAQSWRARIWWR